MAILKCNIITLNVSEIWNCAKRRSIFSYLKNLNCYFYLLRETFWEPKDELVWKNKWGGDVFFSHGSNHRKGVCILVNPSIVVNIENGHKDIDRWIIAIQCRCNRQWSKSFYLLYVCSYKLSMSRKILADFKWIHDFKLTHHTVNYWFKLECYVRLHW